MSRKNRNFAEKNQQKSDFKKLIGQTKVIRQ